MATNLLLTMDGWQNTTPGNTAHKYDNDAGVWTSLSAANEYNGGLSYNSTRTHKGGWDGNRWYSISATGGLHAYTPTSDSWTGPLVSGTVIVPATANTHQWCMCSDGAYVYIMTDSSDFRRYDPSTDQLTSLSVPPGSAYANTMFLTYDGSGSIYGCRGGDNPSLIGKYNIANNAWTTLPSGSWSSQLQGQAATNSASWPAFLQGCFWLVFKDTGGTFRAYQYVPSGNVWNTKATSATSTSVSAVSPGGENTDTTITIWRADGAGGFVYDIVMDSWAGAGIPPNSFTEGTNFAVTRQFSPAFIWYMSDGTTELPITVDLGSAVLSQTLTYHAKVKTPVGRAAGVTVSVPVNISSDAATVVGVASTSGGPFSASFSTGALNPGDEFDIFISLTISASQTLGLSKRFFLEVSPN